MKQLAFVGFVLVAVAAAWSAGFAQARVADFEILVDAPTWGDAGDVLERLRLVCLVLRLLRRP